MQLSETVIEYDDSESLKVYNLKQRKEKSKFAQSAQNFFIWGEGKTTPWGDSEFWGWELNLGHAF